MDYLDSLYVHLVCFMPTEMIQIATTDTHFQMCCAAIQALRPNLAGEAYLTALRATLADNRMMIFIEQDGQAAAVAVFEIGYNLFRGKYLYIDDLSTLPAYRGRGLASQLLDWILDFAVREGYQQVHLDSSVSAARTDAHRLYLNKRFQITSLHFVRKIEE